MLFASNVYQNRYGIVEQRSCVVVDSHSFCSRREEVSKRLRIRSSNVETGKSSTQVDVSIPTIEGSAPWDIFPERGSDAVPGKRHRRGVVLPVSWPERKAGRYDVDGVLRAKALENLATDFLSKKKKPKLPRHFARRGYCFVLHKGKNPCPTTCRGLGFLSVVYYKPL